MVNNLPANAEDVGSIPGPTGFHMLQGNKAPVPQLLKPVLPGAFVCIKRSHCCERAVHHNWGKARAATKTPGSHKDPVQPKIN